MQANNEPEFSDTESFRDGYFLGYAFMRKVIDPNTFYRYHTDSEFRKGFIRGYYDNFGVNIDVLRISANSAH